MQPSQTLDLASLVARHASSLIEQSPGLTARHLDTYWVASRTRLDRWAGELKRLVSCGAENASHEARQRARWVMEEVLVTEVLARVWTAAMAAHDRRRGVREVEPIAHSVLVGHLDARHRVLSLLLQSHLVSVQDAVSLNRLRYRTECWADALLASLAPWIKVEQFGCDPRRAARMAADLWQTARGRDPHSQQAVLAWLQIAFHQLKTGPSLAPELNRRISAGVLGCFSPTAFDDCGVFRAWWVLRMESVPDDAEVLIGQYLGQAPSPLGRDVSLGERGRPWPPFRLER